MKNQDGFAKRYIEIQEDLFKIGLSAEEITALLFSLAVALGKKNLISKEKLVSMVSDMYG